MAKAMDFSALDRIASEEGKTLERERWKSRDTNPTVQMSVRMEEEQYLRFRALCKMERRTNGDMVNELVEFYIKTNG